jgi:hypothetical protein
MGPRLSLVLAFLVGVGCTVGAYETVRLVRTARQVLAITSGQAGRSPGDAEAAPSGSTVARARATRAGGSPRVNAGTPAANASGEVDPVAARQASMRAMEVRQAKRARMAKMAERRKLLGLPEDPREAKVVRREILKAAVMAAQAEGGPAPVEPPAPVPKVDTGR